MLRGGSNILDLSLETPDSTMFLREMLPVRQKMAAAAVPSSVYV